MKIKKHFTKIISIILATIMFSVMGVTSVSASTSSITNTSNSDETNKDKLSKIFIGEDNYIDTMKNQVEPYLRSIEQDGYVKGVNNVSLYYKKYTVKDSKGVIVICHGFAEYLDKYNEMIYYFTKMGYSVYGLEHRGHAHSERLGIDNDQVNVEDFNYYVRDFKTFMDEIVVPNEGKERLHLFAHSMGGLIGTLFLEQYPGYFKDAILNSPMLGINSGNVPEFAARIIAENAVRLSLGDHYVFGQNPFDGKYDLKESGTSSDSRYKYNYDFRINNKCYQNSGASFRWLNESYKAIDIALKKTNVRKIEVPVMLTQAGNDTYVDNESQNKFKKNAVDCKLIRYPKSKHETYKEKDKILKPYLVKLFNFYDNK